jgi:hypothetical protein
MNKNFVATTILTVLEKGPIPKKELISKVEKTQKVTVQAIYKELKKLTLEEVILTHGGHLSLNLMYISKEYTRWSSVLNTYEGGQNLKSHFLDLKADECMNLKFRTLSDLDAYWVHASLILDSLNKSKTPSYSIIPHDWFLYARHETDIFWTKSQKEKMRIIVNGTLSLDKEVTGRRIKNGYKICSGINPLKQQDTVYYTLLNGYVFKVTLDKKIQTLLLDFIKNTKKIASIDFENLNKIINTKCRCMMKISNDPVKFLKMTNKCKKYFS